MKIVNKTGNLKKTKTVKKEPEFGSADYFGNLFGKPGNPTINKKENKKLRQEYTAATKRGLSSEGLGDLIMGLSGEALAGTAIKGGKTLLQQGKKLYNKSTLLKPFVDFTVDKTVQKMGPLVDHLKGIRQGVYDIKKGRPFFETFPVTSKQKAYMTGLQEKAVKRGEEFSKNWYYDANNNLRPEVREKLAKMMPRTLSGNPQEFNFLSKSPNNPIHNNPSIQLVSTRRGELDLKNFSPIEKNYYEKYVKARRGKILGFNTPSNENIILKNQGFYARKPKSIENTVVHEYGGHSGQNLGFTKNVKNSLGVEEPITEGWGDVISKNIKGEVLPNLDSKIGRQSGQVLSDEYWFNSPLELHAELMPTRKKLYDEMIKKGMSSEEAITSLHNPSNEILESMTNSLSRHFKPGASESVKKELIKALPAIGGVGVAGVAAQEKKQGSKDMKTLIKYKDGSKSVSLAFSRKEKDPKGGLTQKGVDKYNRATGGNLKMAVTTPPSKLKPGSKAANRRKSFCARMSGVKGPMAKNGKPTRKALALRKWNC